uniref:zinc-binding protein A33-like n=1 Tax=Pristiophorus japonicus TaxID=55135 RepID=UPI00398EF577
MASAKQIGKMEMEATCPICGDLYRDPVTVDCGHNFCRACISQHWEAMGGVASCPQCREQFPQRTVRGNPLVSSLVHTIREMTLNLSKEKATDYCEKHDEKIKMFCEDDQSAICLICTTSRDHANHTVRPLQEAAEVCQEKLKGVRESLQIQLEAHSKSQGEDKADQAKVKKQIENLQKEIETEFTKLHDFLRGEERILMMKLKEKEEILLRLEENWMKSSEESASICRLIANIQQTLKLQAIELLKVARSVINRCDIRFKKPPKVSIDLNLGDFVGPLQYITWRRMLKFINPAPGSLTLDPLTAHPSLELSDDMTHVKRGAVAQRIDDHQKRFSNRRSVLGSTGFTSGRHYWEVKVGSSTLWVLGVVGESVARKETFPLEPKAGVWAIGLWWQDGYKALSSPPTHLALSTRPKQVGIYLDYEAGQLAFYNTDDMSHLYTFTDMFRETVYPYFSTSCKADSLKLISLQL